MNYFWPGSVNTHWGPGPVNTNWGPGPEARARGPSKGPGTGKYKYPFYPFSLGMNLTFTQDQYIDFH